VTATIMEDLGSLYEIKISNDENAYYYILKDSEKIGIYKKLRELEKRKMIFYK